MMRFVLGKIFGVFASDQRSRFHSDPSKSSLTLAGDWKAIGYNL
jgi:hypothetical protein